VTWFILSFLPALLLILLAAPACAPRQVPARGEPIRVGQVKNEELSLRQIPLERYVAGVLEKEVHGSWPLEALKAQAVATRTYALYRKQKPRDAQFDVLSDTTDQVFESEESRSPAIVRAVTETEGEALQSGGRILQAFFHSCCGGESESAAQVWPGSYPDPLDSVHGDPYCAGCPSSQWTYRLSLKELKARLADGGFPASGATGVEVSERDDSGRAVRVLLPSRSGGPVSVPGTEFRRLLGNTNLKSTLFEVVDDGDDVVFAGRGAGHGVGLCQWGAKGMAEQGKGYREILDFYYPGAEIVGLSAESPETRE
jgi:stage II sporulation protein D (peptidoglycan lytic transglycosylase)